MASSTTNTTAADAGDYFEALRESEQAGTAWKCRCGCLNPGTWDTCQECQHPGNV